MARYESDREDLLREATALVERAELQIQGFDEPVVIGFRTNGAASVFIGAELVYQFNSHRELRRGYQGGCLLKAENGRLAALRRLRKNDRVQLVCHDLSDAETRIFTDDLQRHLDALVSMLAANRFAVVGQAPVDADVVGRIRIWLESLPRPVPIAAAPNSR